jgi:hypothetical protein
MPKASKENQREEACISRSGCAVHSLIEFAPSCAGWMRRLAREFNRGVWRHFKRCHPRLYAISESLRIPQQVAGRAGISRGNEFVLAAPVNVEALPAAAALSPWIGLGAPGRVPGEHGYPCRAVFPCDAGIMLFPAIFLQNGFSGCNEKSHRWPVSAISGSV